MRPVSLSGYQWVCSGPAADHTAGDATKKKSVKLSKLVFAMSACRKRHKKLIPVIILGEGACGIEVLAGSRQAQSRCEPPKVKVRLRTH